MKSCSFVVALTLILFISSAETQNCPPCELTETVKDARERMERAFGLSLGLPTCGGVENLKSCREIGALLDDAMEALEAAYLAGSDGRGGCLFCDPTPHLGPLLTGLGALGDMLEQKGFAEFEDPHRRMQGKLEEWGASLCCGMEGATAKRGNPERDARKVLGEKCGPGFTDKRKGLRQVLRVPDDGTGCFQSRSCRPTRLYHGYATEPGYWSYDGEYWYIWAERQSPQGQWIECKT